MEGADKAPFRVILDNTVLCIGPKVEVAFIAQSAIADYAQKEHQADFLRAVALFTLYSKLLDIHFTGRDGKRHHLQVTEA